MTVVNNRIPYNDQNGAYNASTGQWENAGTNGNLNFVPGSVAAFRFPTRLPSGVTINSATLKLWYNTKFGNQNNQSNHTLYIEVATKNSAPLVQGEAYTSRRKHWIQQTDVNILADTGNNAYTVDVTKVIKDAQAFGLEPGGHVTFFVLCNTEAGDMNWKLAADGAPPELNIDYSNENEDGQYWDFNFASNPSAAVNIDHWGTNSFFNAFALSGAAVARDTTFLRDGRPTIKWTCPTPEAGKNCGPVTSITSPHANTSYIYCGWIYIPSALNAQVYADFFFFGGTRQITGPRDTWIPFCSTPLTNGGLGGLFATIIITEGFTAGQNIWLSDVAILKSNFRQMPFAGLTTNTPDVTHYSNDAAGRQTFRRTIPRVYQNSADPTNLKPKRQWMQHSDGIWKYNGSTRQSTTWDKLETNGMTWDQLEATGKTWAQLESEAL